MSLKDFKISTEVVPFRGGSLELRGLSLNDFSSLMRGHLAEINSLFKMYENEATRETAMAQSAKFAITVVQETPALVAQAIVLCSDAEQEDIAIAQKLPLPVQVECVRKIIELTFEEAGGAKKFLDSVVGTIATLAPSSTTTD